MRGRKTRPFDVTVELGKEGTGTRGAVRGLSLFMRQFPAREKSPVVIGRALSIVR